MLLILLILIFIRPFISSLAFPYANHIYSLALLLFLLFWFLYRNVPWDKVKPLRYPLILFIAALAISIIFSQNKITSLRGLYLYAAGVLLFLVSSSFSESEKNKAIFCMISAGIVIGILAIYQYFFGFKHVLEYMAKENINDAFALDYIRTTRVYFPFVTPNTLGGYLAMIIPLSLAYKKKIWLLIILSFALVLTRSLGALLSLFLAIIIYLSLRKTRFNKRNFFILGGLFITILAVFVIRVVSQKEHTQPVFSTIMRLDYWRDTFEIIKRYPLTGVGTGNFNLAQSRYAHNSYLQIWTEMGIFGLVSFLYLLVSILRRGLKNIKAGRIAGLIMASAVFLIHNLVDFSFFLPETAFIWWIISGFLFFF